MSHETTYVVKAGGEAGLTTGGSSSIGAGQAAVTATWRTAESDRTAFVPLQNDWTPTRWWSVRGSPSGAPKVAVVWAVWKRVTFSRKRGSSERSTT